jgi:flagellum-specific ATP synthase
MSHAFAERLKAVNPVARTGRITRIQSTALEADGPNLPLGALCEIETAAGPVAAMVARVDLERVSLVPLEDRPATFVGASVRACASDDAAPVGDAFLGRAVDALGRPVDGAGRITVQRRVKLGAAVQPLLGRLSPRSRLETGIRAIDTLLTLGQGQRIGLFAAAGAGKTSLVAQFARQVEADRCVICLVGERGREVDALWNSGISPERRAKSVLVAATSDQSAAMRARACEQALALAGHWRDEGHHVLFLLDSVTRYAMALREIGLAAGEPPTVRALTPGVFAALPKVVERCGALKGGGAITAFMTVLAETDDVDDPVAETMKSLLDGHILLSRTLAERRQFPAIDVPRSVSRLASDLQPAAEREVARKAVECLALLDQSRALIESGLYEPGANVDLDAAIALRPKLLAFLAQGAEEHERTEDAVAALAALTGVAN